MQGGAPPNVLDYPISPNISVPQLPAAQSPLPPLHKGGMTSKTGSWFHSTEHSKTVVWREANSLPYGRLTPNS